MHGSRSGRPSWTRRWVSGNGSIGGPRSLPLGFKQRLALGAAILHKPAIIFLDEPTSGVDPIARRRFWELINELAADGVTIIVTTHYMDEAEYCNRLCVMHAAKIVSIGSPAELKSAPRRAFDRGRVRSAREGRMKGSRIPPLARKEFKHILRDPRSLWIVFMLPNVMMFLFGYAIDLDLKDVRLGVCDLSRTPQSRELVEAIDASSYFSVVARYENPGDMERLFERRVIRAGVIVPRDFARALERERRAPVGIVIDGSDANSASIVQNYLETFIATRSAGGGGKRPPGATWGPGTPRERRAPPRRSSPRGRSCSTTARSIRPTSSCRGSWRSS